MTCWPKSWTVFTWLWIDYTHLYGVQHYTHDVARLFYAHFWHGARGDPSVRAQRGLNLQAQRSKTQAKPATRHRRGRGAKLS